MNDHPNAAAVRPNPIVALISGLGAAFISVIEYLGGLANLWCEVCRWVWRALVAREVRFGRTALYSQIIRVGVRSVGIIALVSSSIGLILVMQMAPPLTEFGQTDKVANVNAVAVLRELGPLISAILLTGFAGASIAAELGTMVVGEEIEALESMGLNPVRFLVVPRVLATVMSLVVLCVLADVIAISAGAVMGVLVLDIPLGIYKANTLAQAKLADFLSGLCKAGVFGALIGLIACYNGLRVRGGAAGVGRATTMTVVLAIVSIIFADLVFTAAFYALGWH
jgi:phospholipid/cholesterol/gamma-HCH transport system permease protein